MRDGGELAQLAADSHPSLFTSLFQLVGGITALVSGSVALDGWLDRDGERVKSITNAETSEGVRMYVARPAESNGDSRALPAVILVHQFFGVGRCRLTSVFL